MMQLLHKGVSPGKTSIMFLPLLNMDPNNNTCIYSTLRYVIDHADRHNVDPVITFDQPLWWKAKLIMNTKPAQSEMKHLVLRLGPFHMLMSFLGSIGHLMAGSGIEEILELLLAKGSVGHALSGKAYARAIRAHFIIALALNSILFGDIL